MLMFKKNSLLKVFCLFFCFLFTPITKADDIRCVKVVLLGKIGSGKTTLHTALLSESGFFSHGKGYTLEDILHPVHTTDLSVQTNTNSKNNGYDLGKYRDSGFGRFFPIQIHDTYIEFGLISNYKPVEVRCYIYDTSAEQVHENAVDVFCNNAHAIFLCVKAEDFTDRQNGKLYFKESQDFYKLLRKIPKIAPKSKVIIFLTQIENIEGASNELKGQIKNFIKCIKDKEEFKDYVYSSFNFQLDYSDPITQKIFQHENRYPQYNPNSEQKYIKEFISERYHYDHTKIDDGSLKNPKLEGLIVSLINKHGFDYFPKTPKGFSATIEKEEKKYVETYTNNDCTGSKSTRTRTKNEYKLKVLKNADEDKD